MSRQRGRHGNSQESRKDKNERTKEGKERKEEGRWDKREWEEIMRMPIEVAPRKFKQPVASGSRCPIDIDRRKLVSIG